MDSVKGSAADCKTTFDKDPKNTVAPQEEQAFIAAVAAVIAKPTRS
jgi:hypothetical protein